MLIDSSIDINRDPAIEVAAAFGYENIVKTLIDIGADVDAQIDSKSNALISYHIWPHKIVKTFLDSVANVNATDIGGEAPLSIAAGLQYMAWTV